MPKYNLLEEISFALVFFFALIIACSGVYI